MEYTKSTWSDIRDFFSKEYVMVDKVNMFNIDLLSGSGIHLFIEDVVLVDYIYTEKGSILNFKSDKLNISFDISLDDESYLYSDDSGTKLRILNDNYILYIIIKG